MTVTLGIRLEDKNRWERRTPIVPEEIATLLAEEDLRFVVQPSNLRIYNDDAYRGVGAEISEDLSAAKVVFAVKEIPLDQLLPRRTYVFFSHVIKGQAHNMPLLVHLLRSGSTLIDYERIADERGRLVFFGREAGQAGMIDGLHFLGRRLDGEGQPTPLTEVKRALDYDGLEEAKVSVAAIGERLARGFEVDDAPLVVGFTGNGNVSQGAQEIFDLLPHVEVTPEELAGLDNAAPIKDRIVKVCFSTEHLAQPREAGKAFDDAEYRAHPERFQGGRLVSFLPHLTMLMHGVYWNDDYPRFLTRRELSKAWQAGQRKLRLIGDVTCDVDGSIELTYKATHPDHPVYIFNPVRDAWSDDWEEPGVVVLAVDNFPCELPRAASQSFSRALHPFVPAIARADYSVPFAELALPSEVKRAVITHGGKLTPEYEYLRAYLD
jgi:saccharopine dehydrogenase (NAD+, L-lysine-forming)